MWEGTVQVKWDKNNQSDFTVIVLKISVLIYLATSVVTMVMASAV